MIQLFLRWSLVYEVPHIQVSQSGPSAYNGSQLILTLRSLQIFHDWWGFTKKKLPLLAQYHTRSSRMRQWLELRIARIQRHSENIGVYSD